MGAVAKYSSIMAAPKKIADKMSASRIGGVSLRAALVGVLCSSVMANSAVAYNGANAAANSALEKKLHRLRKHAKARGPVQAGPQVIVYKGEPPLIPACSLESAALLDKTYDLKGWIIPPPKFEDTLTLDYGCWRTNLAKMGFGFITYNVAQQQSNMLNHYVPPSNLQKYTGQRWTGVEVTNSFLMYDLSRYGVPDGQIQIAGFQGQSTYLPYQANEITVEQLAYYQTFFDRKLEFNIGYIGVDKQFVGTQVGGNIANIFGPSSAIQAVAGGSYGGGPTPTAILRWNINNNLYDKGAVLRSNATTAPGGITTAFLLQHYALENNPLAITNTPYVFGIHYPTTREMFIDEVGYKNVAAPHDPYTWVRATGYYNASDFENLQYTTQETKNYGGQFNVDRQIWQTEPGSPDTAYKGFYIGGTAAWLNPKASGIYEDFVVRLYGQGLLNRPRDQISLIWEQQDYSPYTVDSINAGASCRTGATCARHAVNQYSLLYSIAVMPGVHITLGAVYVDHPSLTYAPSELGYGSAAAPVNPQLNINHALNFAAGVYSAF
jgi:porin